MDNLSNVQSDSKSAAKQAPRRSAPRLGAFVTIAASLLLLFGAASRIGKVQETVALFGIDRQAENRIRQEEERLRTALMIGSAPVQRENIVPHTNVVGLDPNAMPPSRGDFDIDGMRHRDNPEAGRDGALSLSIPQQFDAPEGNSGPAPVESVTSAHGAPPSDRHVDRNADAQAGRPKTYRVQDGDTWVKVAKRTLGDANRWRELMNANPAARDGLRVGMELAIPQANG